MVFIAVLFGLSAPSERVLAQRDPGSAQEGREVVQDLSVNRCCLCVKRGTPGFCTRLTRALSCGEYRSSGAFLNLPQINRNALVDYTCSDLPESACNQAPASGAAETTPPPTPTTPTPSNGTAQTTPASGASCPRVFANFEAVAAEIQPPDSAIPPPQAEPPFVSITPQLGVPIPGLSFSPARKEGTFVYVPFLAQYISAVYRYSVSLAIIAAIVMMVYGGFRYLLGSATQDVSEGKRVIVDALIGMLIALGAYAILNTINPNTLELPEIKLGYIEPSYYGEGEGANEPVRIGGGQSCRCSPIPQGINETSVLKVPCYHQWDSAWGNERYGINLVPASELPQGCGRNQGTDPNERACSSGKNQDNCLGTIGQGGCGITSLATVMAYYGFQVEGRLITPVDAGKYAVRSCLRPHNGGTSGICSSRFSQEFPGYRCDGQGGGNKAERAAREIRAGHPVIFHCGRCTVTKGDGNQGPGSSGAGHYMVLTGVSETGQLFSVHDVGHQGRTAAVAITAEEVNSGRVAIYVITPPSGASAPPAQRCTGSTGSRGYRGGGGNQALTYHPFTYCPRNTCGNGWDPNKAWLMFPTRLLTAERANLRVFIYLHGNNNNAEPENDGHTRLLRASLARANPTKDIVIVAPHYYGPGHMRNFRLTEFYEKAREEIQRTFPRATIMDIVVGGHSGASCAGTLNQALRSNTPVLTPARGFIVYDGCQSDGDSRLYGGRTDSSTNGQNFAPSGHALIVAPDAVGMGIDSDAIDPRTRVAPRDRITLSQQSWGFSTVSRCPSYVPSGIECYPHPRETTHNNEWWQMVTHISHPGNVEAITDIAFKAFYGQ